MNQHSAIVTPRLKSGSDQGDVQNYREIPNLTFMSNVVERLVCHQLVADLEQNGLLPELQFAYIGEVAVPRPLLSRSLLRIGGDVSFLSLLDLTAAFDTVDQAVCYGVPQGSVFGPVPCLSLPTVRR